MSNPLPEIERFLTDRLLDQQPFNAEVSQLNIMEELLESMGWGDNKDRELSIVMMNYVKDVLKLAYDNGGVVFGINNLTYSKPTTEDIIDARGDNIVFSIDDMMKLGYDPSAVLLEVAKEINSREGEIVDGKFTKYKTEEAMAKWHKADFTNCKRK